MQKKMVAITEKIAHCPICFSRPERESYTFHDTTIYIYACPKDHVVPDEMHASDVEAREEWARCVDAEIEK